MGDNTVWNLIRDLETKRGISDIMINDSKRVFVERQGEFIQLNVQLRKRDIDEFISEVVHFNKRKLEKGAPLFNGRLPDGARINIMMPPFVQESPVITIRKYLKSIESFDGDHSIFGLNSQWVDFFKAMISSRCNVIISGGTGVGKTTLINLLLKEVSGGERVITIEDTLELSLDLPNAVRLEALPSSENFRGLSMRELVKNTLRMRPDRIIIGEVRGGEAFDLLQAMNTGHDGSLCSIHASSPRECLSRIESLFMMAGFDMPNRGIRQQISMGVDFIIQLGRTRSGERVMTHLTEITGMEAGDRILTQDIALRFEEGGFKATGIVPKCMDKLHELGGLPLDFFKVEK